MRLDKEIREGDPKPESRFNEALSAARPGKEPPTRSMAAELCTKKSELVYNSSYPYIIGSSYHRDKAALPHRYPSAAPLKPLRALTDIPHDAER